MLYDVYLEGVGKIKNPFVTGFKILSQTRLVRLMIEIIFGNVSFVGRASGKIEAMIKYDLLCFFWENT
jgi:hypothetical protein